MRILDLDVAVQIANRGSEVIKNTESLYRWNDIIQGANVSRGNGDFFIERAVDRKTWRVFWRRDIKAVGASYIFDKYFLEKKDQIIEILEGINSREQLDTYEDFIIAELKPAMENMISDKKLHLLGSYNALRKPLDLYFANLASMSEELTHIRSKLVEYLFVPLDKIILSKIPHDILLKHSLRYSEGFTFVRTKEAYIDIQEFINSEVLEAKEKVGIDIYPIYIELLWNERYKHTGNNFWEINRGK
jgi:hypothetical protein